MHICVSLILLVLTFCSALVEVHGQEKTPAAKTEIVDPKTAGPLVEVWEPKTGSVDSIIYLSGKRLYPGDWNKTKAFIIQNGVEFPARTGGGWSTTNDLHGGPHTLLVILPEGVVPGKAQIVVEFDGHRSKPAAITITEWKAPVIKSIDPTRGAPGTLVRLEGEGFHVSDQIDMTDANGTLRPNYEGSANPTVFEVPRDAPEGIMTVRIGNSKYGKGRYTESLTFTVTNEPLPIELDASAMKSVAPGQWLDLQITTDGPLKRSELTEVAFTQAGRTIIVATSKPFRTHVAVPSDLSPGEVQLQLRTWRKGRSSQWSDPASFELADKPLAPFIETIKRVKGGFVSLTPGPDRATSFDVSPGDDVVLSGLWPVADASKLRVSLVQPGGLIIITPTEVDEKANWFSEVQVRIPESLKIGDWRMIVSSVSDGTGTEIPIVIRIVKK